MNSKVQDIMTPDPVGVYFDQTIADTARIMRDAQVGAVLVVNGESLAGVVTDRDLVVRGLAAASARTRRSARSAVPSSSGSPPTPTSPTPST